MAINIRSNVNPRIHEHDPEESNNNNGQRSHRHKWLMAKERHARRGSRWSESEATRRFRAHAKLFDTGTRDFNRRSRPSAPELIALIQRKNRTALLRKNNSHLTETAFQIAQHESGARNQITWQSGARQHMARHQGPNLITAFESLWEILTAWGCLQTK